MSIPQISVVMSVYNGEKHLSVSIESILTQGFSDFEFIIVNDGSKDRSLEILRFYEKKDKRIKIIDQQNKGLTKSLNIAIRMSQGSMIARQDADDISMESRLEKQVIFLREHPDVDLVTSWVYIVDEMGQIIIMKKLPPADFLKRILPYDNLINHTSVVFRKSVFFEIGGYDERCIYAQDTALWQKFHNIAVVPDYLVKFRWGSENITYNRYNASQREKFRADKTIRFFSTVLIQQGEIQRARALLARNLRSPRHLAYYMITLLPKFLIDFYMWNLRFLIKRIYFFCYDKKIIKNKEMIR